MPIRNFCDKVAVVTGSASGIGLAIAKKFHALGCHLALVDIHQEHLEKIKKELSNRNTRISVHVCDIANKQQVSDTVVQIIEDHKKIDILVNSAGVSLAGNFSQASLEDFEWVMDINFRGTVYCCKYFLPHLMLQQQAHIVNISSCFGFLGFAGKTAYSSSKFAVRGFSEALRMELYKSNVGVSVLYPGPVNTNIVYAGRVVDERQRDEEAKFLASRAIPAERVAHRVVKGIKCNSARIMLSSDYFWMDLLTRLSPSFAQRLGAWITQRMPFSS